MATDGRYNAYRDAFSLREIPGNGDGSHTSVWLPNLRRESIWGNSLVGSGTAQQAAIPSGWCMNGCIFQRDYLLTGINANKTANNKITTSQRQHANVKVATGIERFIQMTARVQIKRVPK